MSERETLLLIIDIQSSIEKILDYTKGMTTEAYLADSRTKDAVEQNFSYF